MTSAGVTRAQTDRLTLAAIRAAALADRGGLRSYVLSLTDDLDLPDRQPNGGSK